MVKVLRVDAQPEAEERLGGSSAATSVGAVEVVQPADQGVRMGR